MNSRRQIENRDNTQRLFFALWPNDAVRSNIAELLNQLALHIGARKVCVANLHLTLVFVGPVHAAMRACMEHAAADVCSDRFVLTLTHTGHWKQPRIVWLAPTRVPPALLCLVRNLENALVPCHIASEVRPFRPHITLAHKVKDHPARQTVAALDWNVESFALVESCSEARGVSYHVLNSWPLHKASPEPN